MNIEKVLKDYKKGKIGLKKVISYLKDIPYKDIGNVKIDFHRRIRRGFPEVVFGEGKRLEDLKRIIKEYKKKKEELIITRLKKYVYEVLKRNFDELEYDEVAEILFLNRKRRKLKDSGILIITAGTSDIKVAEEARITCELFGYKVDTIYDIGVAGIHRVFGNLKKIRRAKILIVVAGMDGILPTIISGLTSSPVIAVPTSVGYGSNFKGLSSLLTMLNSCSPGIAVVNIDNGFGAGYFASIILKTVGK